MFPMCNKEFGLIHLDVTRVSFESPWRRLPLN